MFKIRWDENVLPGLGAPMCLYDMGGGVIRLGLFFLIGSSVSSSRNGLCDIIDKLATFLDTWPNIFW